MKIGLNVTCFDNRPSGAARRLKEVYGGLFQLMQSHEFILFEPEDCSISSWFREQENVVGRQTPMRSGDRFQNFRKGWEYWRRTFREVRLDLFESFNLPAVDPREAIKILTIHDPRYVHAKKH